MLDNSSNPHAEAYARANDTLAAAREALSIDLQGEGLHFIRTKLDAQLRNNQQMLQAMGGASARRSSIAPVAGTDATAHGPVTNILGQEIVLRQPIVQEDYTVTDQQKAQFLARRNALLERLADENITDDQLTTELQQGNAENLFRAAARKAGLEDYREAPLNIDFIQRLRASMRAQAEVNARASEADLAALKLKQSNEDDQAALEAIAPPPAKQTRKGGKS